MPENCGDGDPTPVAAKFRPYRDKHMDWVRRWAKIDYQLAPRPGEVWTGEAFQLIAGRLSYLYLVVLGTIWVCAYRFAGSAPLFLTLAIPLAFTVLIFGRLFFWQRVNRRVCDAATIRRAIFQLQIFSPLVGFLAVSWTMSLYGYGNIAQQGMVHFLTLTCGIFAVLCLSATPFAGSLIACSVIVPSSFVYFLGTHPNGPAVGLIQMFVFLCVIRVAFKYQRSFQSLAEARRKSARRERAIALRAERSDQLASTDPLTGLLNRRAFLNALEDRLLGIDPAEAIELAMIDLDGFKDVNDSLGHAVGDVLLQELASRLETIYPDASIGRLGGDEFAILFQPGRDISRRELVELAERLSLPVTHDQLRIGVSASIGLYKRAGEASVAECLERADHAMYAAKQEDGPSVVVYDLAMERQLHNRQKLIAAVSRPGFEEFLTLAYQPIVDAKSKFCVGIEALSRWDSPGLEGLGAAEFISIAESCGQMREVTRAVVTRAVRECPTWERGGSLFLNISGRDLMARDSMDYLGSIIVEAGCSPEHIVFEVTETALINVEAAVESMQRLRDAGFRFALDDFGSGQSSLNRVHRLPIDVLKIDGGFIENIVEDARCRAAVGTVLELAKQMQVDCVVEGIETLDQCLHAVRLGARLMQGYHFARPGSAQQAMRFLDGVQGMRSAENLRAFAAG